jgi:hypothetical protein
VREKLGAREKMKQLADKKASVLVVYDRIPRLVIDVLRDKITFVEADQIGLYDRVFIGLETAFRPVGAIDEEKPVLNSCYGATLARELLQEGFLGRILLGSVITEQVLRKRGFGVILDHPHVFLLDLLHPETPPDQFWEAASK